MSEDIQNIINQVKGKASYKKLKCIENYFSKLNNKEIKFESIDSLEAFLKSSDVDDVMINNIYELLEQNFSIGFPYFVMEFSFNIDKNEQDLKKELEEYFHMNEKITFDDKKFIYLERDSAISYEEKNYLNFSLIYERYKLKLSAGDIKEKGPLNDKITFDIFFDFRKNLLFIKCGEQTYANTVKQVMSKYLKSVSIISFSINYKVKTAKFEGELSLSRQSAVIFDLLHSKIRTDDFELNDYLAVNFHNDRKETKMNSVTLKGNNLFETYEVVERLTTLDNISSIKFQLTNQLKVDNIESATQDRLRIDFLSNLKITFYNTEGDSHHRKYIHHVLDSLYKTLEQTHKGSEIDKTIREQLDKAKVKDSYLLQQTLDKIIKELNSISIEEKSRKNIYKIVNEYKNTSMS